MLNKIIKGIYNNLRELDYHIDFEKYSNGNFQYIVTRNPYTNNIHHNNGPAEVLYYEDGTKQTERYYNEGMLHREDGPAVIEYGENGESRDEYWFYDGFQHREDGPARILYDNKIKGVFKEEWWFHGKSLYEKSIKTWLKDNGITNYPLTKEQVILFKLQFDL